VIEFHKFEIQNTIMTMITFRKTTDVSLVKGKMKKLLLLSVILLSACDKQDAPSVEPSNDVC
jgi:hypothetical protein